MRLRLRLCIYALALAGSFFISAILSTVNFEQIGGVQDHDVRRSEKTLLGLYSESEDSQSDIQPLIRAVEKLSGRSSVSKDHPDRVERTGRGGYRNKTFYLDLARRLLDDGSFLTADEAPLLIELGKALEQEWKRYSDNGTVGDEDKSRSAVILDVNSQLGGGYLRSGPKPYPEFFLDEKITASLSQYITAKMARHKRLNRKKTFPEKLALHKGSQLYSWQRWQNDINQNQLYDGKSPVVDSLLHDMTTNPIIGITTMSESGTQIKLIFEFLDGSKGLFKPMRWSRDRERDLNIFYFSDFERHHAEIAAFHLDRVMEFYRVPPNVGRFINITKEIEPLVPKSFKKTIFVSPAGNKCFHGKCEYYCDSGHPVCGNPEMIEGSVAAWLPFANGIKKKSWENPWRRSYSKFRLADWETEPDYCDKLKKESPYNSGRCLLDVMDITVFDYLMGNQDRHHYHTFKLFGNQCSPFLYDNGRGFGFIHYDDPSILLPIRQCCKIRFTTLAKLIRYETGPRKLSELMVESLRRDPLSSGPNGLLLCEGHLKALDRRVSQILDAVWTCIQEHGIDNVVIDDGF